MSPPRPRRPPPPPYVVVSAVRVAVLVFVVLLLVLLCGPCNGGRSMLIEGADRRPGSGTGVLHRRKSDFLPPSGPSERHNARLDSDVAERGESPPPASP
ncbi:hypothetical protein E2562_015360 [Oryza meyeriana var. granulata]|uniref:Uncharacterized protein n=1 Tax=Oryza meyeriana var. granulata TaxID=110450 RepID=A0A6G1EJY3_9ORYZ|nr:hypothetical protein E2562_015360 [Oryza meyeriana var. granulata]